MGNRLPLLVSKLAAVVSCLAAVVSCCGGGGQFGWPRVVNLFGGGGQVLGGLQLENIRAAGDLSFLCTLTQLTGLSITGDSNSIKSIALKTLAPLRSLAALEWLRLATVTVADESLAPIGDLPSLKQLHLSNRFRMEEFASLAGRLPNVQCDFFTPVGEPVDWTSCKKCKQKTMVMLTGRGIPWLCTGCDATRIQRHEDAFFRVAEAARSTG